MQTGQGGAWSAFDDTPLPNAEVPNAGQFVPTVTTTATWNTPMASASTEYSGRYSGPMPSVAPIGRMTADHLRLERDFHAMEAERWRNESNALRASIDAATTRLPSRIVDDENIPLFDPDNTTGLWPAEWIERVERVAAAYEWPAQLLLSRAVARLRGAAHNWFVTVAEPLVNWEQFRAEFLEAFPVEVDLVRIHAELAAKAKSKEQSYTAYVYEMAALGRRGRVDEKTIVRYVLRGVDEKARGSLAAIEIVSIKELVRALSRVEALQPPARMRPVRETQWNSPKATPRYDDRPTAEETSQTTKATPRGRPRSPSARVRCFRCKNFGHIKRDCPEATTKETVATVLNAESGTQTLRKYMKVVRINGTEVQSLIDTGSSVCLVRQTTAMKLQLPARFTTKQFRGIGRANIVDSMATASVKLEVDGAELDDVELHVMADNDQPTELIIGRTFLDHPDICFNGRGNELLITRRCTQRENDAVSDEPQPFEGLLQEAQEDRFRETVAIMTDEDNDDGVQAPTGVALVEMPSVETKDLSEPENVIQVGSTVTDEQRARLNELIREHRKAFAMRMDELGKTDLVEMKIEEEPDSRPVVSRPYKVSRLEQEAMDKIIRELVENGIVTESVSPYSSPALLVEKMTHADALSRAAVGEPSDTWVSIVEGKLDVMTSLTEEEYALLIQRSDPTVRRIIAVLEQPATERKPQDLHLGQEYELCDKVLCRRVKRNDRQMLRTVVPKSMRKSIVIRHHDQMGHFGVDRTAAAIGERWWFGGMRRYIKNHIARCPECLVSKIPSGRQPGLLHPIPPGRRPFATIHLDHLGPFVTSKSGNKHLLVAVDDLTKFTSLWPVKSTTTDALEAPLEELIRMYGTPERLICDRGTCFTSRRFERFCSLHGMKLVLNSSRHPRANGQVERVNRTIVPALQARLGAQEDDTWDEQVQLLQRDLNAAENKTTGFSPYKLLYGYQPRFEDAALRMLAPDGDDFQPPASLRDRARERIIKSHDLWKAHSDPHRAKSPRYEMGQIVFMRRGLNSTGESAKLQPKYRGPLKIVAILPADTYRVVQIEPNTAGRRFATTSHVSGLKRYPEDEDSSDGESSASDDDPGGIVEQPTARGEEDDAANEQPSEVEPNETRPTSFQRPKRMRRVPRHLAEFDLDGVDGEDAGPSGKAEC